MIRVIGDEEEHLIFKNRAANFNAPLIEHNLGAWGLYLAAICQGYAIQLIEIVVRVESPLTVIPPGTAMVFISAAFGDKADLYGTTGSRFCSLSSRLYANL